MPERSWTIPQKNAIEARGGSLLVSAAAGSGKTAVLVERVVGLISDAENPVDVDKLLIVTFSIAAASEMRQRISARLAQMIQENPGDFHLQRQQALLQKTQISTIHAFCLSLIRDNFQNLEISPDFSIADIGEMEMMMGECISGLIERYYEQEDNAVFLELVELLSSGRDDSKLAQVIYKIYQFSRSHPFFEDWLDEKEKMYAPDIPISRTIWGQAILAHAKDSLTYCHDAIRRALEMLYEADEKLRKAYLPAFESDMRQLSDCLDFAAEGAWDDLAACLNDFVFDRLGSMRGADADKEFLKSTRDRVKKTVQDLAGKYINASEAQAAQDIADLAPKIHVLFSLVKEFSHALWLRKSEKRRLDFSDLEHLALSLLIEKGEDGYTRTAQALEIARQYDYVMVDEYQDTNEVQDLIFTSVSRTQNNLFMVGDVKQSIYSFRQAMPEIFLKKRSVFFPFDGVHFPATLSLDTNFRSRGTVTEAVNFLFKTIMSNRMGGVDYDAGESLKQGARYPDYPDARPELCLINLSDYDGDKESAEIEAETIALKIRKMIGSGYAVTENGLMRPARPRDFCILLRSPRNRVETYVKALEQAGIPAWAENAGGFLQAREVSMVLSLLKALNNPLLDIELAAALSSPLFDFSDDDIVSIRLAARRAPFYTALHTAALDNAPLDLEPGLAQPALESCVERGKVHNKKAADFLALFQSLRKDADHLPADRLLLRIYERTNALDIVRAMPMGESRRNNLLMLIEYASQYHAMGYKRLSGFVGFISRLEERGGDLRPANSLGDGADVVRIMSIHKSKGLEFPIVILADTAKNFNKEDLRASTLLHAQYGFACVRRDMATLKQYPTVPMQAIRLVQQRSLLSEEMRVLYVALTRAREKLIITSAVKTQPAKKLAGLMTELTSGAIAPYSVGEASSYADWILMALLHHASADALRECAGVGDQDRALTDDGNDWRIQMSGYQDRASAPEAAAEHYEAEADPAMVAALEKRAGFVYPYRNQTKIPTKLAVSSAAKGAHDAAYRFSARPTFM
ncbi:MAG: helicase-exonuclease AddAB subunit AddA, partial [Oscillospiraceae bacterium]|nr:helicase-exonuclease AddAB subunit AddA [Oscillospiraceae bacterium]